ncbi:MAG: hypothetical protein KIT84_14225 [Labilithrix sp.]|nr:hypothetical protein [Labilithrix sp.]MCW5812178.1 hypothetical protein [Labilithrix sp.]
MKVSFLTGARRDCRDDGTPCDRLPSWDGNDPWVLQDPEEIKIAQGFEGTVDDWVLRISLERTLSFGFAGARIELSRGVFVADIQKVDGGVGLVNAVVAGSSPAESLLHFVNRAEFTTGSKICNSNFRPVAEGVVCSLRDLRSDMTNGPCDALSLAFGFSAVPVTLSDASPPPFEEGCEGIEASVCP